MFGLFKKDRIGEPLVESLRCYLGSTGVKLFKSIHKEHGTLNAIEWHGPYPHGIVFREGMQVRNYMRMYHRSHNVEKWSDQDYDILWEEATLRACNIPIECTEIGKR